MITREGVWCFCPFCEVKQSSRLGQMLFINLISYFLFSTMTLTFGLSPVCTAVWYSRYCDLVESILSWRIFSLISYPFVDPWLLFSLKCAPALREVVPWINGDLTLDQNSLHLSGSRNWPTSHQNGSDAPCRIFLATTTLAWSPFIVHISETAQQLHPLCPYYSIKKKNTESNDETCESPVCSFLFCCCPCTFKFLTVYLFY